MSIRHTIISWDSTFRNFFHLIDAILAQTYEMDQVELIYVQQRDKTTADQFNHRFGLQSLDDRQREVGDALQLRVEYLDDPVEVPYHLGKCVNRGLALSRGEIISVMDGDMLLPSDFLVRLDEAHQKRGSVVNLLRLMASRPVGTNFDDWTEGIFDYEQCLTACPPAPTPFPVTHTNKGPMISAPVEAWRGVHGYDEHPIWSTGLSRLGQDVTARLEMLLDTRSFVLAGCAAVHPYHPAGFSRSTLDSVRILTYQADLIDWATSTGKTDWHERLPIAEKLSRRHSALVARIQNDRASTSPLWRTASASVALGRIYRAASRLRKYVPFEYRRW